MSTQRTETSTHLPTSVLLTDLYQLTMLQAYFEQGMDELATFEFFVRRLPKDRGFLVAAGLEQVLEFLENLHFSHAELDWLRRIGRFTDAFVDYLEGFRFAGDVYAMPEGTVFFAEEPVVRVTAPIPQAQLVESRLINLVQFQTIVASKAARCVLVAPDKLLIDFGMRRAHGAEAATLASRASYLAGFSGTSTVLADVLYGIPSYGTMAHSFVEAHDSEMSSFEHFAQSQPDNAVLLVDTYDTEQGAEKAVAVASRLAAQNIRVKGLRLDSGDLVEHSRRVRAILDNGGLKDTRIFCSGSLDEYVLKDLVNAGAPIDGFGIGTRLETSADAPYLDCAYKLMEYAGRARRKHSEGKQTWPGRKQVYRRYRDGVMVEDILTLEDDVREGKPLLQPVMRTGNRLTEPEPLQKVRDRAREELATLPVHLRNLETARSYSVTVTSALKDLAAEVDRQILASEKYAVQ